MKKATITDIAKMVGISIGTASNALNGKPTVKADTVARVQAAARQLGYLRNPNAASLRSHQTDLVAVVVPNIENAVFSQFVSTIEQLAAAQSKGVIFMAIGEDESRAAKQIESIASRRVDGLIVISPFAFQPLLAQLKIYKIPVILADRIGKSNIFPSVSVDNWQAGYIGGQHLFAEGFRKVDFVSHGSDRWMLNQRKEGFRRAATEAGMLEYCRFHDFGLDPREIRDSFLQFFRRDKRPDAVFAASNLAAKGVIPALLTLGIRTPGNVGLLVMDDFEALSLLNPPISVVNQPTGDIARTAWEMLQATIEQKKLKQAHVRLPPELIVRGSTIRITPAALSSPASKEL